MSSIPFAEQCDATAPAPDDGRDLCCWRRRGHDGPHYDEVDDVTWQTVVTDGRPEAS